METAMMPTLFDGVTVPQIVLNGDTARTRFTDPWSSHLGGDRSQDSIPAVKAAVISMLRWEGSLTGSALNRLYAVECDRQGWPVVHFESPRKRVGELAVDGLVNILNEDAPRGTEREYTLIGVSS